MDETVWTEKHVTETGIVIPEETKKSPKDMELEEKPAQEVESRNEEHTIVVEPTESTTVNEETTKTNPIQGTPEDPYGNGENGTKDDEL